MKKFKILSLTLLICLVGVMASCGKKNECQNIIYDTCSLLDEVSNKVEKVNTLEEFEAIDYQSLFDNNRFKNIPDDCKNAAISEQEKEDLKESLIKTFDILFKKIGALTEGTFPEEILNQQADQIKAALTTACNNLETYGDFENFQSEVVKAISPL